MTTYHAAITNYIHDRFSGKGKNTSQSVIETESLTLKGCLRLPSLLDRDRPPPRPSIYRSRLVLLNLGCTLESA